MTDPNFFLFYVESPPRSAEFYAGLLGRPPLEASPTFALFALDSGVKIGFWSSATVEPVVPDVGVGGEIAFAVPDVAAVTELHTAWTERGLVVVQAPVTLDFGHTFVALDPDGHRLRVFAPS
jgi:catechol 2,3-dioxygenase-like lactoylglutathione lyase family enzyme